MSGPTLRALLNRPLKSDEILEWLRDEDMEVIYDLDRLQEGSPDRYWTAARSAGFQLCFNENQLLRTIFCYIQASEEFSPIDTELVGVPIYWTFDAAATGAQSQGLKQLLLALDEPTRVVVVGKFEEESGADLLARRRVRYAAFQKRCVQPVYGECHE